MSMLNNVNITGRVTADLEMQERGETKYIRFSFANEEGYGDKKHTNFLPIIAYNKSAENMSNAGVKKGSYIWIMGTLHQSTNESNGKKYNNIGIVLSRWGYCGYTKDENAHSAQGQNGAVPPVPPPPQNPYPAQPAQGTVPPPVQTTYPAQQTGQAPPPHPPAPPASGFEGIDLGFPPGMDADDDGLPF